MELRLLEHFARTGPMSVREVADTFGKEHEVGLTTVQQMMDRLCKKGLMTRQKSAGSWIYKTVETRETVLKEVVRDFIERTLGGSLEPFMLYLSDPGSVSSEQLVEVRQIVDRLSDEVETSNE